MRIVGRRDPQVRAPGDDRQAAAARPDLLAETAPSQFPDPAAAVALWGQVWSALYLQERYMPLDGLDAYQVAPSLTGEILRSVLDGSGDIRMHVSNGALASFTETLPLLHPYGRLLCHDLFVAQRRPITVGSTALASTTARW